MNTAIRTALIAISLSAITGCCNFESKVIHNGDNKKQVISKLGEPSSTNGNNASEIMCYKMTTESQQELNTISFYILLRDGKVIHQWTDLKSSPKSPAQTTKQPG